MQKKKNIGKLCFMFVFVLQGCLHVDATAKYNISVATDNYTIHNFHGPFFPDSLVGFEEVLNKYLSGESFGRYTFDGIMGSDLNYQIGNVRYGYLLWVIPPFLDKFAYQSDPYIIIDFDDERKCYLIISAGDDDLIKQSTGDYNTVSVRTKVTKGKMPTLYEFEILIQSDPCK